MHATSSGKQEKAKTVARSGKANQTSSNEVKPKGVARQDKNKTCSNEAKPKGVARTDRNKTSTSLGLEKKSKPTARKKAAGSNAFGQSNTEKRTGGGIKRTPAAQKTSTSTQSSRPVQKNTSHMQSSFTFG